MIFQWQKAVDEYLIDYFLHLSHFLKDQSNITVHSFSPKYFKSHLRLGKMSHKSKFTEECSLHTKAQRSTLKPSPSSASPTPSTEHKNNISPFWTTPEGRTWNQFSPLGLFFYIPSPQLHLLSAPLNCLWGIEVHSGIWSLVGGCLEYFTATFLKRGYYWISDLFEITNPMTFGVQSVLLNAFRLFSTARQKKKDRYKVPEKSNGKCTPCTSDDFIVTQRECLSLNINELTKGIIKFPSMCQITVLIRLGFNNLLKSDSSLTIQQLQHFQLLGKISEVENLNG